jgi:protein disulfide-isomerase
MKTWVCLLSLLWSVSAMASVQNSSIAWFDGSFDGALKVAQSSHKPLFVYWGARWCPPCNALKSHVFRDSGFVAATRQYVAVHIDGDSESAQNLAERLRVSGYPTLMILNSQGQEVQRLVTYESPTELTHELQAIAQDLDPIEGVVDNLIAKPESAKTVSAETWARVARHDWLNDDHWHDRAGELSKKLSKLAQLVPAKLQVESKLLELQAMALRAGDAEKHPLSDSERKETSEFVSGLLSKADEFSSYERIFAYSVDDFAKALFPAKNADAGREQLIEKIKAAYRPLLSRDDLSSERRSYVLYSFAGLSPASDKRFPKISATDGALMEKCALGLVQRARQESEKIEALNMASYVYEATGNLEQAKQIVIDHLPELSAKNEMMSTISDLEKKQGHKAEALTWAKKAYGEATGHSTRLQWGYLYVKALTELTPKDHELINRTTLALLDESLGYPDALKGRNGRYLNRLSDSLGSWAKTEGAHLNQTELAELQLRRCKKDAPCDEYLKKLGVI